MSFKLGDAKRAGTAKAKSTSPIEVTIDRSKWRCGSDGKSAKRGEGLTQLLNNDGFMCCLGFASLAAGVDECDIKERWYPRGAAIKSRAARELMIRAGMLCGDIDDDIDEPLGIKEAIHANDSTILPDRDREAKVRAALKKIGMKVKFVGRYHKPSKDPA